MGVRVFVGCSFAAVAAVAGIEAERPRRHAIAGDGSVHESPKQLPSEVIRILGLLQTLGLVIFPARSAERARSCSATTRDRSRGAGCYSSFAGLLPEQSDPRTRQPRRDRKQTRVLICGLPATRAGCRSGTILGRVSPCEDWKPATRLLILPPIASSGSAETSSRPGLQNVIAVARHVKDMPLAWRRQDRPPCEPSPGSPLGMGQW